ncbi:MAG: Hsp33 family molecular chaperone [Alphaproteobacteria bacterium]
MTASTQAETGPRRDADDLLQPFQIEARALRGRLLRQGPLVDEILGRHAYPVPVATLLGEALVLAALLGGALKFDGVFTLQTKGDGPVSLLVADMTSDGAMRGYAQFDGARLAALESDDVSLGGPEGSSVPRLLGGGHLAFTVDQGTDTERYQGIVALEGGTLAECAHHYFRQSEQIDAAIRVAVGQSEEDGSWRSGGLMLQRMPIGDEPGAFPEETPEEAEEGWRRALALMGSITDPELLAPDLTPDRLLYRIFHEDGVRVFQPQSLFAGCRCSRERVETTLGGLGADALAEYTLADGSITVTCEFCNSAYRLDSAALARLEDRRKEAS